MDAIATRLDSISDLRTYAHPPDSITPPVAIVDYPETYEYDATYGRGMDRITLRVWLVLGRPAVAATRDLLAAYADGSGARSVKAVLESGTYTAFDTVRVMSVEFDPVTVGDVVYMSAQFNLDVAGQGAG
jgi:hypothetical protein